VQCRLFMLLQFCAATRKRKFSVFLNSGSWLSPADPGDRYRHRLGQLRLGDLLELGPEGDLVADCLVHLRGFSPCPDHPRVGRTAWLSIVGFAATIFCYLGVNQLLSGLHSYGG